MPATAAGRLDPVVLHTMSWSAEFAVPCVAPAAGATLRLLAACTRARTVVELGTGLGVSGLWLMQGLAPGATVTSIDIDPDHQAMARQAFAAAGHTDRHRVRLITGRAERMLDRLLDDGYDLVLVDLDDPPQGTDAAARPSWLAGAARVLRPDGLLVVHRPTSAETTALAAPGWTTATLGPDLLAATASPASMPSPTPADPSRG